jgi:hypothetical protein
MAGTKRRASCKELFKKYNIVSLASKFLLSLSSFVVDNIEAFQTNSDVHNISTRYRYNLHVPNTNLSKYQKGIYYSGMRLFNEYLLSHSFYSVEEFTLIKNSQLL